MVCLFSQSKGKKNSLTVWLFMWLEKWSEWWGEQAEVLPHFLNNQTAQRVLQLKRWAVWHWKIGGKEIRNVGRKNWDWTTREQSSPRWLGFLYSMQAFSNIPHFDGFPCTVPFNTYTLLYRIPVALSSPLQAPCSAQSRWWLIDIDLQ